jgi:Uma2 family endonuclease
MVRLDASPSVSEEVADELKLPTNLYSDEPQLETDFHRRQIDLLIRLLEFWWQDRSDFYISGNLTVYYNEQQLKRRDFVGPDIFIVLGAEKRNRRSWAIWEEGGKYPNVVIELLSSSTAAVDKGKKKDLYQNVWRAPDYFWFHPQTMEFAGFHLVDGQYQPIPATEERLWSEQLGLFLGIHAQQLRLFTADGVLIPLPEEQAQQQAQQAQQQAQQAQQQAQQAQQRAVQAEQKQAQLEAFLRSQGFNPDQLPSD